MTGAASPLLIYGANGYTGRLVVQEAIAARLHPVLSGRNTEEVRNLAAVHGLEARPAALDHPEAVDAALAGCSVVIHCAGPFSRTAKPMVQACLRNKVHYLDITGEISVFESLAARSNDAERAGVMLVPGVGFDVVPTDCLAAHLKRRLPDASSLALAFSGGTGLSRGTATTMVENIARGGAVRRDGKITPVPAAWRTRDVPFDDRTRRCVSIPWGDVSTAFHSTGIPNIEVYTAAPVATIRSMKLSRYIGWILATAPMQRWLKSRIQSGRPGPTDDQRRAAVAHLWGEAFNSAGERVTSRLRTPDGYSLTALTAVAAARKVMDGVFQPGFCTPSRAFGTDFILEIPGTVREDLPASAAATR